MFGLIGATQEEEEEEEEEKEDAVGVEFEIVARLLIGLVVQETFWILS